MARTYDLSSLRILIVDDSEYMRRIVSMFLRSMGVRQVVAMGGVDEAVQEVCRRPPDLVVTDWLMRPKDGLTLVNCLRGDEDPEISHLPIIVLPGFTDIDRICSARDAGVHDVLAKPVSAATLYQRIVAIIEQPRPFLRTDSYFGPERALGGAAAAAPLPVADDDAAEELLDI